MLHEKVPDPAAGLYHSAQPLFSSTGFSPASGLTIDDRKLPGVTPSMLSESTPIVAITKPFAVLGEMVAPVTFPLLVWLPEASTLVSYGAAAAPVTSNITAVDPELSVLVVVKVGPVIVELVRALAT